MFVFKLQICFLIVLGLIMVSSSRPNYPYFRPVYNTNRNGRNRNTELSYGSICRGHAVNNLAFPGQIGNPVCPW